MKANAMTTVGVVLNYALTGSGWAECRIQVGKEKGHVTASYLSDALKNFLDAFIHVSTKFPTEARFSFDEEPGEYRWVLVSDDKGNVNIKILEFQELWSNMADDLGKLIFNATCKAAELLDATYSMCNVLLEKNSLAGYETKWANAPFPTELYQQLCEITGKPVSELIGKKYAKKKRQGKKNEKVAMKENIKSYYEATVNLSKCKTWGGFKKHLSEVFDFPNYFGGNLNSVNDCMRDLGWLSSKNFKITLINQKVLIKHHQKQLEDILEMFDMYTAFWDRLKKESENDDCDFIVEIK